VKVDEKSEYIKKMLEAQHQLIKTSLKRNFYHYDKYQANFYVLGKDSYEYENEKCEVLLTTA